MLYDTDTYHWTCALCDDSGGLMPGTPLLTKDQATAGYAEHMRTTHGVG